MADDLNAEPSAGAPDLSPAPSGSPSDQPAPPMEAPAPPAAPPQPERLLAEYTRSRQELSTIKRELGLSKDATPAEVTAALQSLRSQPQGGNGEIDFDDPELAARRAALDEREWQLEQQIYGDVATDARAFYENMQGLSPGEFVAAVYSMIEKYRQPAAPEEGTPPAGGAPPPPEVPDLASGDQPLQTMNTSRPAEAGELANTGRMRDFVAGLFGGNG